MDTAWSVLTIKSLDDEKRIIEGIASTPEVDRVGDVIEPRGAKYALPMPLLWQHDKDKPIGHVIDAVATDTGIFIRARIDRGLDFIDHAWELIKRKLVRGLSIGFRSIDFEPLRGGGLRYKSWEWLELSTVTIPANQAASIHTIKALDRQVRAVTHETSMSLPRLSDIVPVQPPKATSMVNFVRTLAIARSSRPSLLMAAGENFSRDEKLQAVLRAAVSAGTLTSLSTLAPYQVVASEFVEASRASSIVGRLNAARHVPLRIKVPRVTTGSSATWVGEGIVKPITSLALDEVTLDPKKNSVIVVTTEELARFSNPGSDALLRNDLIRACNTAIDSVFVGTSAATSSTPGGILNGTTPVTSTGSGAQAIAKDINTVIGQMITAGGMAQSLVILAHPGTMAQIGLTLGATGATLGIPVLTSSSVPAGKLIVLDQAELLLGDEGNPELSLTTEASVMMDSAPVQGTTAYTGLWQHNLVGIRCERFINWVAARSNAATAGSVASIA